MLTHNTGKTYNVTFIENATGLNTTIQVRSDENIMDIAEQHGIELSTSCRAGACISCTGRLLEGSVEYDHCFLKRTEIEANFILPCSAYPRSDCTILTHQEDALLDFADRI